jgi:hypothetical protein
MPGIIRAGAPDAQERKITGMPELGGHILDYIVGRCAWCGRPTNETAYAEGLGRELPLDIGCAFQITFAYRRWAAGLPQRSALNEERMKALYGPPRQLGAG